MGHELTSSEQEQARLAAAFERGGISRRDLLQGLLAAGVALPAATAIVAGARDAAAQTPRRGGRLRYAWNSQAPSDSLDPITHSTSLHYLRGRCYFNNLVQFQDDLSLKPDLATEWSVSQDGLAWTFRLRQDVEWHDGSRFTADDVVYSMSRHLGANSTSLGRALVSFVREWRKLDQFTVRAELATPNNDLPAICGTFNFRIVKNDAHTIDGYFRQPIGTGPFRSVAFTPGVSSLGARNPNYFGGEVWLDEIETFSIPDPVARVNALISGQVEMIGAVAPTAMQQVEAATDVEMWSVPSGSLSAIIMMQDRAPGNNPDFVAGMKLLANRTRMTRVLLRGTATMGNDQPVGPAYGQDHCRKIEQRELDVDRARFHLQRAGISRATIEVAEISPGITDTCLMIQADARRAGLDLEVRRVPSDGYWSSIWRQRPIFVTSINMRPTANSVMALTHQSEAPWNASAWRNERFDALLPQAQATNDASLRAELQCEMQRLVRDEAGVLIPYFRNTLDAKSKRVRGVTSVPLSANGGMEWPAQVWLAS